MVGAGDGDAAKLERLAQRFEHAAVELRQLVQEQHALVRERHLARARVRAAADHGGDRSGVVRAAKRPPLGQPAVVQQPGDAGDHAHFQDLGRIQRRQQPGQARRENRLARPRRADQQQVVAAGGGNLERAFGGLLAFDVGELGIVRRVLGKARYRGAQHLRAIEVVDQREEAGAVVLDTGG